ncbi:PilW family protein [Aromatoleum anaerobium]|uniref:Pilus assembly protein PilW n=2 Tax=Aromatoleum TaxID=551759 RepID=A0ABX1PQK0_9RHOO|nr:PilW family protein [Aromatoleum anaerobium]MCK0506286.1 PilW family protein [Aromatoleum anaerobium]
MRRPLTSRQQQGLTIVELMISLTLSLLLLGGVLQVFIGSKQAYRTNEALSRMQESGRFAIEFLSRDLRMTGYQGCANLETMVPNIIADPPVVFTSGTALQGANNVAAGTIVGGRSVAAGTDTVTMRFADPADAQLRGNLTADNANIQVTSNPSNWKAGDVLFITDCETADIFRATNVSNGNVTIAHAQNSNTSNRLSKAYGEDAIVMSFRDYTYYVSDTGRLTPTGHPILSLYRDAEELVEGVRSMQVLYGVDPDDDLDADNYVTANAVTDWASVVAARVCVVAESVETNVATEAITVPCNGVNVAIPNNRLGQIFTTTIGLRNRLQ